MKKYDFAKIEKKWRKNWKAESLFEVDLDKAKNPFYNLMMFPYPSAEGLHVGNMYAFVGSDIYGRYMRMRGKDVFEPIGLDGFGIHSENYALKIGTHPAKQAEISEKRFYDQLEKIGNGFAWDNKLETYDPEYYKWTQWIFIQLFKNGLAYRKKQAVNWCLGCKTVLADEQVISGKCERCESKVIKKELEQWFFGITKYADRLLKNLDKIDWSEKIKVAQKNWIGKSEGALIKFGIKGTDVKVPVFTTRPDTLFGATYLVLAPEHKEIPNHKSQITNWKEVEGYIKRAGNRPEEDRLKEGREKTGIELKGIKSINPATGKEIPIWAADYVLGHVGTGAIMAVPAHDERDFEFAKKFKLPIKPVILTHGSIAGYWNENKKRWRIQEYTEEWNEHYSSAGELVDSEQFSRMDSEKAKWEITKFVGGKRTVQYRLRDWLISRQRYWGPPIPMIFCPSCAENKAGERREMSGWYTVPEKDLPVKLPKTENFRSEGKGRSPLASIKSFYKTKCPSCGGKARRETDVSDTFLDSAWYYIGYLMSSNVRKPGLGDPKLDKLVRRWLPVDMYIGGAEHAVLHLLYVRFISLALYDLGILSFGGSGVSKGEPFPRFRAHGLLIKEGNKMSKSKGNVVNPDEYIKSFGIDALRMYLMFLAPFEQGGDFRDAGITGITRFLDRVWALVDDFDDNKLEKSKELFRTTDRPRERLEKDIHRAIKKVTGDVEGLKYNTAISELMVLLHSLEDHKRLVLKEDIGVFLRLLAPFAPHITEEIWRNIFKNKTSIHKEPWPSYKEEMTKENSFILIVQVNGKVRDQVEVPKGLAEDNAKKLALESEKVKKYIGSGQVRKVIYIQDRLINIVV